MRTYPSGVPCWIDVEQPDKEAACHFYGSLFGWTFEDAMPPAAPGYYVIAQLDGSDAAAIGMPGPASTAEWNTYIAVDDADAVSAASPTPAARSPVPRRTPGRAAGGPASSIRVAHRFASGSRGAGSAPRS